MPTRLIKELEGKTAEEQCDFIRWLVFDYAMCFTDSRTAVIEWLKKEVEDANKIDFTYTQRTGKKNERAME